MSGGLVCVIYSFMAGGVIWGFEKTLWPRGNFLEDDRHRSVSVDDSILKTKFEITCMHMRVRKPKFMLKDIVNKFHLLLFVGWLGIGSGIWILFPYFGFLVPGFVWIIYAVLGAVVFGVWMRHLKLIPLKIHCVWVLSNYCCGACLYELQGLIPESDGCVVCPECGGAWRLDRCPECTSRLESVDADSCAKCSWKRPVESYAESEPAR